MPRRRPDQAEGLRRLLDRSGLRVVSISGASGGGHTAATVVNLAAALVECGGQVLVLDGQPLRRSVTAALGLAARFNFEDVIQRRCSFDEAVLRGPAGIRILPLERGARALSRRASREQQHLSAQCVGSAFPVDTLLVDAVPNGTGALLWPGIAAQEVIVLGGRNAAAITGAYALIKRLSVNFARREFHVLVGDVASEADARAVFANMAGAARRYLDVSLYFMGHIPPDDKLLHAARLRLPVVSAFPSAAAARSFRGLAHAMAGWPRAGEEDCGFDDFMRRLIHFNGPGVAAA